MSTTKTIGILLLAGSIALGYLGITKIADNSAVIGILDLKIDVSNESGKTQGYHYLEVAVLLFAGGIYSLKKK